MPKMYLDICLSDIPKGRIKTAKNGKKYFKAIIAPRREPDQDGYDHFIAAYVPRDERLDDDRPLFIGRAQDKTEQQEQRRSAGYDNRGNRRASDDLPPDYDPDLGF